ncbi:TauD/TfdA family dioxygenase [Streptomyces sp. NBC_00091]|uniref:TauD/TfdA family dioxygenase n=1 Tax=Streptomyces sp. NBC_00091 TaxID=2975648 RepID=UPI00224D5F9B|nr:TauD/TfdA family dioxygenase [Streptomyces sp. NBC_00091]MCX5380995.1 TauD/TfdA family dioxygenase [Streptomyces sp. NBC_00091]
MSAPTAAPRRPAPPAHPGHFEGNTHTRLAVCPLGPAAVADPAAWATENLPSLLGVLRRHGALLLRGFPTDPARFEELAAAIGGPPLDYTERSTPRSTVAGRVYTSTAYPPDQTIPLHNESSYASRPPGTVYFLCAEAAPTGGATPIADGRAVLRLLPPDLVDRFRAGVLYTRVYREGLGLSWQEGFQSEDPHEVEERCRAAGIAFEWTGDGALRTRHHRPALVTDPAGGAEAWFNQAHLFHSSALEPEVREALLEMYGEQDLPRNAYFADGTPIPDADLAAVRAAYDEAAFAFPWQEGDLLILDNLLVAHGREPFTGPRQVLVAMTGPAGGNRP